MNCAKLNNNINYYINRTNEIFQPTQSGILSGQWQSIINCNVTMNVQQITNDVITNASKPFYHAYQSSSFRIIYAVVIINFDSDAYSTHLLNSISTLKRGNVHSL